MRPRTPPILIAVLALMLVASPTSTQESPRCRTAILGAFDAEVVLLEVAMDLERTETHLGVSFALGRLAGSDVVLARTGIGKVNAAVTTALLIEHYRPREVIFTGIAGGLGEALSPGDIVVASALAHHDFVHETADGPQTMATRNPVTGEQNPIRFPTDERLHALAFSAAEHTELHNLTTRWGERQPRLVDGIIVSGDSFVASADKRAELRARCEADAVEMEGAAVAQVCHQTQTPFIVIRSLSDSADEAASEDLAKFYKAAAANSAAIVLGMVELLASEAKPADQ